MNITEEVEQLKIRINNLEDRFESYLDIIYKQDKLLVECATLIKEKLGFDVLELTSYQRPKFVKNNLSSEKNKSKVNATI